MSVTNGPSRKRGAFRATDNGLLHWEDFRPTCWTHVQRREGGIWRLHDRTVDPPHYTMVESPLAFSAQQRNVSSKRRGDPWQSSQTIPMIRHAATRVDIGQMRW